MVSLKKQNNILKIVRSNKLFAKILQDILPDGQSVPMKTGTKGMIPALAKTDEKFQELCSHSNKQVRDFCITRQMVKSWPNHIKRIDNMMNQAIVENGKLRVDLKYYGGHTGRWSGSGGTNLQNLGGRGRGGQGTHPLISAMRGLLCTPDGSIFLIPDSRQIEARVLAWIAGQIDLIDEFAEGKSPYCTLAAKLFGEEIHKPSKEEKKTPEGKIMAVKYGFGKDGILGCGYGMGTNTFYQRCRENTDLRPMFDSGEYDWDFIDKLIKTYRRTYAKIPEFWTTVEKAFKWVTKYPHEVCCIDNKGLLLTGVGKKGDCLITLEKIRLVFSNQNGTVHLQLPSGRVLTYRHCRVAAKGGYSTIQWHYGHLWGGAIAENIVQSIARDLLGYWILELEKANLPVVLHSHDETVSLIPKTNAEVQLQLAIEIMSKGPDWAEGLPLSAEGELSERYKK